VDWSELGHEWWLWLILAVAAVLTYWEPFIAPVPRVVPAETGVRSRAEAATRSGAATATEPAADESRTTLLASVRSTAFKEDFGARAALRKKVQEDQDKVDRERAKTAGTLWRLKQRWRRRIVRPVDDWFYRPTMPRRPATVSPTTTSRSPASGASDAPNAQGEPSAATPRQDPRR
jgi:hypothetical protein